MLGITLRSAIEEISAVPGGGEVVIVDNSDEDIQTYIEEIIPRGYKANGQVRLIKQDHPCLFTARETAAREAKGEYILCVGSHCLFGHGTILAAVHFMNRHKNEKIGFGHLPLSWLCQFEGNMKHDMKDLHGGWGTFYNHERPISWKGMPWICRRDWFLNELNGYGAFSKHRLSWGGGDMYLGLKTWMIG